MSYSKYFEDEGFFNEIDEARKTISAFQNYRHFSYDLIAVVLIGGFLVNLIASASYDYMINSVEQNNTTNIFWLSFAGLIGLSYLVLQSSKQYLPRTLPTSIMSFHLSDITQRFGFRGTAVQIVEKFTRDGITEEELKLFVDKMIEFFPKRFSHKHIYNLQLEKKDDKWLGGYRVVYLGNHNDVNVRIQFWISKRIALFDPKIHDITFGVLFTIINPQNQSADDTMNKYGKFVARNILDEVIMTGLEAIQSLNEKKGNSEQDS